MQQSQMSSPFLTMTRLLFAGLILLMLAFVHGDKIFRVLQNRKDAFSLLFFSLFGALTVQYTFLMTIEKSNAATATVLQFLSPTIIVAWFALARKTRPGPLVLAAIGTSLAGTFLLVTHGNPTTLSISPSALLWGVASAFAAAFYTTWPSTLIARYGTLPIVSWRRAAERGAAAAHATGHHLYATGLARYAADSVLCGADRRGFPTSGSGSIDLILNNLTS